MAPAMQGAAGCHYKITSHDFAWQAVLLLYRHGEQHPHGMTGGGGHAGKCLDGASWGCGESPRASEGQSLEKQSIGYQIHRRTETGGNMGRFTSHLSAWIFLPISPWYFYTPS